MALASQDKEEILELIEQAINARPEVINSNVRYGWIYGKERLGWKKRSSRGQPA